MNDFSDLCNRLFVALFEKYLVPLELQGYAHHVQYPVELDGDLILVYEKEIYFEVIRTSHCDVYLTLSDTKESRNDHKIILLEQLIFLLSNNEARRDSLFTEVGCYYTEFEPRIKRICSNFFQYHDEIIQAVKAPNFQATLNAVDKNMNIYREAADKARRDAYLSKGKE